MKEGIIGIAPPLRGARGRTVKCKNGAEHRVCLLKHSAPHTRLRVYRVKEAWLAAGDVWRWLPSKVMAS